MTSPYHDFLKPTNIFCIVGIFIPGFTMIGILGLQMLISFFGVECSNSWRLMWVFTTIGSMGLPAYFFWYVKTTSSSIKVIKQALTFFNIFEYTFLQATIGMFFSDGKTLCYVIDGQNGLQFVFTGWFAIPILIGLSLFFREALKKNNNISQRNS
ncbi:MAG: hypothetical protein V4456_12310 [Bacteroidota bacterium]